MAALFVYHLTPANQLEHLNTLTLPGNPLALCQRDESSILLSLDHVHRPNTRDVLRSPSDEGAVGGAPLLLTCVWREVRLELDETLLTVKTRRVMCGEEDMLEGKLFSEMLYPLESLRKMEGRGGDEA